jgi:hypothetical protein
MKWLCVLLLFANVAYFGWEFNESVKFAVRERQRAAALPADVPALKLISELAEPPRPRAAAVPADAPESAPAAEDESLLVIDTEALAPSAHTCFVAGPFADDRALEPLQAWLTTRAVRIFKETKPISAKQLYGVYFEPKDSAEAEAQMEGLRAKGVEDYLLIKRRDLTSAISLGLFSTQDAVNKRLQELERQGYTPVVVPYIETKAERWLRAELTVGNEDLSAIPADVRGDAAVSEVQCAALVAGHSER